MVLPHARANARRSRLALSCFTAASLLISLSGCSASLEDEEPDGVPMFGAPPNGFNGTSSVPTAPGSTNPMAPNTNGGPPVGANTENPVSGAPIQGSAGGSGGSNGNPNGASVGGTSGDVSAAGSGMGVAGSSTMPPNSDPAPTDPPLIPPVNPPVDPPTNPPVDPPVVTPPPAPADPTPQEIEDYFASLPCGAKYSALGDGGWQMCLRLADGGGACANGSEVFQRVTFAGGAAVTNVAQVSGMRDSQVSVVTTAGALHVGGATSISTTPLIPSGVVNVSGGYHASVALVEQGDGLGIRSWTDNGTPTAITLPGGAQPIQVSANYGLACALSTAGQAFCWNAGGNHSMQIGDAPTNIQLRRAVQMISVGQNSVCGVSFDGTLECQAAWYDNPYLPTEGNAPNFQVRQSTFPSVREVHSGFRQGIVVKGDGTAVFLGQAFPPSDNPGEPFTGVTNIIAAGGDRGNACVQTSAGAVFCRVGTAVRQATLGGAPLTARVAGCPL